MSKDGEHTERQLIQGLARRGDAEAKRMIARSQYRGPLRYLWAWSLELEDGRTYHDGIPSPISHSEIVHWAGAYDLRVAPHEIAALRKIERVRRLAILRRLSRKALTDKQRRQRQKEHEEESRDLSRSRRNASGRRMAR